MNMALKYIGSVLLVLILSGCATQKWSDIGDNVNVGLMVNLVGKTFVSC